jgi:hypothetical protein
MTQNGPYPGQPSQPRPAGGPGEPYREPTDPWGDQGDADHHSGVNLDSDPGHGGYPAAAYPPAPAGSPPVWTDPVRSPGRGTGVPIVALVVVLGLLICGGLGTTAWLLSRGTPEDTAKDKAAPAPTPSTAGSDVEPAPRSSNDARFVVKGQCVRNDGTATKPQMTIAECTEGTYRVLARVNEPTTGEADAERKCAKYPEYTKWFFYDSELDDLDYVLCLRER